MGKFKLIKGRNVRKRERGDWWESFGASEKSRTLQKKRKVWKTPSESQRIRRKEKEQTGESKRSSGNLKE